MVEAALQALSLAMYLHVSITIIIIIIIIIIIVIIIATSIVIVINIIVLPLFILGKKIIYNIEIKFITKLLKRIMLKEDKAKSWAC